MVSPENIPHL